MLIPTPYPGSTGLYHIHKALRLAGSWMGVVEGEGLGIKYFLSTDQIPSLLLLADAFITTSPSSGLSSPLSAK
jgi:hypothetical protein